jgi:dTDP-4-amino-4,6-dideoxygalactose transaminase
MPRIRFVELGRQYEVLRKEILEAIDKVCKEGDYVLGSSLKDFETAFAEFCGVSYAVGVGNGSDALYLSLKALGIGPGDEVITAPNSFIATAWVIAHTGATIKFADVGEDMNLDPISVQNAITPKTKALMPVHLTGRIAKMNELQKIADENGLFLVEDAAQAVGATYNGKRAGSFSNCAGFSLHPLKNLHVAGDGGIITTDSSEVFDWLIKYRNHGLKNRDSCDFWGINSRLDSIQAAIGSIKLKYLDSWNKRHQAIAAKYSESLKGLVSVPNHDNHESPVYHRYMIRTEKRDILQSFLNEKGIETKINYPVPLHLQPAAANLGYTQGSFPVAEELCKSILSLPAYPELHDYEIDFVIEAIIEFFSTTS